MKRVIIIGCSGAGKSTLARKMGEKTGLPVIHLDKMFWNPGWVESTKDETDRKIMEAMTGERWIIDGNYKRTLSMRAEKCDTIVYLDFPTFVCLWGVITRVVKNHGTVRPDMGDGCPERFDWEFLKWVWGFNRKNRRALYTAMDNAPHAEKIVLKNRRQVKLFLRSL